MNRNNRDYRIVRPADISFRYSDFMTIDEIITIYSFLAGFIPAGVVLLAGWRKEKYRKDWLLCLVLTMFLCLVLVYTNSGSIWDLVMRNFEFNAETINLVPFSGEINKSIYFMNLIVLIPFGILVPLIFKDRTVWKVMISGLLFSFLIEFSQLFNLIRTTDIDDLILNTAGALIGACIWKICLKQRKGQISIHWLYLLFAAMFLGRFFLFNELGAAKLLLSM